MRNIYVALVGGQPAPVFFGIQYSQPTEIILVCSSRTRKEAERIQSETTLPTTIYEMSATDLNDIDTCVATIKENTKDCSLVVNVSGGLKPWSILFHEAFKEHPQTEVIYLDQNNVVWNLVTRESHLMTIKDWDVLFRLQGTPLTDYTKLSDYTEEDDKVLNQIEKIRATNFSDFNKLTTVLSSEWVNSLKQDKKGFFELASGSSVTWDKELKEVTVDIYNRNRGGLITVELASPNVISLLFNAGWFEYKVARLLSMWDKTEDVWLNCEFLSTNNAIKNEVDIIVKAGSKFLFIECKTQINKGTDIDKFRSVVKNYGGLGSKAIFITDAKLRPAVEEKCNDNDMLSFSLQSCKDQFASTAECLAELLDNELFKINKR